MDPRPTPAPAMTTAQTTNVDLRDLPYWLDAHGLTITSTRIVGELEGQLWVEAQTRCSTASASDATRSTPDMQRHGQRQGRRGGTT